MLSFFLLRSTVTNDPFSVPSVSMPPESEPAVKPPLAAPSDSLATGEDRSATSHVLTAPSADADTSVVGVGAPTNTMGDRCRLPPA
jgi:hypothetical protein